MNTLKKWWQQIVVAVDEVNFMTFVFVILLLLLPLVFLFPETSMVVSNIFPYVIPVGVIIAFGIFFYRRAHVVNVVNLLAQVPNNNHFRWFLLHVLDNMVVGQGRTIYGNRRDMIPCRISHQFYKPTILVVIPSMLTYSRLHLQLFIELKIHLRPRPKKPDLLAGFAPKDLLYMKKNYENGVSYIDVEEWFQTTFQRMLESTPEFWAEMREKNPDLEELKTIISSVAFPWLPELVTSVQPKLVEQKRR